MVHLFATIPANHEIILAVEYTYAALDWAQSLDLFLVLSAVSLGIFWFLIFLPGRLALLLFSKKFNVDTSEKSSNIYGSAVSVLVGVWIFCFFSVAIGLLGGFDKPVFFVGACVSPIALYFLKESFLPTSKYFRALFKQPLLSCVALIFSVGFLGVVMAGMSAWWDGNFLVAAGQIAATGKYLPNLGDGQHGMVAIVGAVKLFFQELSPVTAAIAWAWIYPPLIVLGAFLLIAELFPDKKLGLFALSIFLLPAVFKASEIRGSSTGFAFAIWAFLFTYRYLRGRKLLDFIGAVFAISAAWNFGQMAGLFVCLSLVLWACFGFHQKISSKLIAILIWVNIFEWPFLSLNFFWLAINDKTRLLAFILPAVTVVFLVIAYRGAKRLEKLELSGRLSSALFVGLCVLVTLTAFLVNPSWKPSYNWFFFFSPASFVHMNFSSYGLFGFVFAVSIISALLIFTREAENRAAHFLSLNFLVSCVFQVVPLQMLKSGSNIIGYRALYWDIWKDTTLHWNTILMPIGLAFVFSVLLKTRVLSSKRAKFAIPATLLVLIFLPTQNLFFYKAIFDNNGTTGIVDIITSQIDDDQGAWKGQQIFTLPLYFAFIGKHRWKTGERYQRINCPLCTVHNSGFIGNARPVIDFILSKKLQDGGTFVTGDSVLTYEHYLNRQVRYLNSPNTVCPIYLSNLDKATAYEYYWKKKQYIRRTKRGVAYTVFDPERSLTWLQPLSLVSGILSADFSVPFDGEYEIYRGGERVADKALAKINDLALKTDSASPSLGWMHLKASEKYSLTLMSRPLDGSNSEVLRPDVPIVIYPRRYWAYEQILLEEQAKWTIGAISVMRFTGVPNAPITIEEFYKLMSDQDLAVRHKILEKYNIRFIILDGAVSMLFPDADKLFAGDPALVRSVVGMASVYYKLPF